MKKIALDIAKCLSSANYFSIYTFASSLDALVGDVVVKFGAFVDDALRAKLDDAIADGLYELVVVARHQHYALECLQVIVECLD